MLPRGYSPKITNGMVRRERALRRLRERVDLGDDDDSDDSKETKLKAWGKRLFTSSATTPADVPMTPVKTRPTGRVSERAKSAPTQQDESTTTAPAVATSAASPPDDTSTPAIPEEEEVQTQTQTPPRTKKPSRPHKSRPRALRILPTQPEDSELRSVIDRRGSPSSFARERMRQIAAKNAPFDDPDKQRAICKSNYMHIIDA